MRKKHESVSLLVKLRSLYQQYGVRRLGLRTGYGAVRRFGILKLRFPVHEWKGELDSKWLSPRVTSGEVYNSFIEDHRSRFFFPAGDPPRYEAFGGRAVEDADLVRAGKIQYFSRFRGDIGSNDPDWFLNPFTGIRRDTRRHWADCHEFSPEYGDVKFYWEPSRFTWIYPLVRAYSLTRDEAYPETFWTFFLSWMSKNRPQEGVNWVCGQEISIRLLAVLFAIHAFAGSDGFTKERFEKAFEFIAVSANRIRGNIWYAQLQKGNHAVTEAAALYTVALLFPWLKNASEWYVKAKSVLESEAMISNWEDGTYTQHSTNYQRLMLSSYFWAMRLAQLNNDSFSESLYKSIEKSCRFLYGIQDFSNGRLPNYGPNDGALLFPLCDCGYLDYRPLLNSVWVLLKGRRLYGKGLWDESLIWFFGDKALRYQVEEVPRKTSRFDKGGYYVFRGEENWGMIRCHTYNSRPNQADLLHLDVWSQGVNLLRDSGSFSYFDSKNHREEYFSAARAHNVILVNGMDQMLKGSRFRRYTLAKCGVRNFVEGRNFDLFEGWHDAYTRLKERVIHRRNVLRLGDRSWVVVDDITGNGSVHIGLLWQLAKGDWSSSDDQIELIGNVDGKFFGIKFFSSRTVRVSLEEGRRSPDFMGWESLFYGEKRPAPVAIAETGDVTLPIRLITVIGTHLEGRQDYMDCTIDVERVGRLGLWSLTWNPIGCESAFRRIECGDEVLYDTDLSR